MTSWDKQGAGVPWSKGQSGRMPEKFSIFEHVRWSDVDRAGIIYYGRFQRFFEIAETELFRAVGLTYSVLFERLEVWLPRVQIHTDFRKPLLLDDLAEVQVHVGHIGNKSLKLVFEVYKDEGRVLTAEGHIILACVAKDGFEPIPVPAEMREKLAPYVA